MSSPADAVLWHKLESADGYPYYVHSETGVESQDHPELETLLGSLAQHSGIKYSAYRAAFKTYELQKRFQVWSCGISLGVVARHCLSISESSLTLEPSELEALLRDVSFACARHAGTETDDTAPHLLLNVLLNMYHPQRTQPVRVQAVKVLLILLSDSPSEDKWLALVETASDHNGCVSPRRLTTLLELLAQTAEFLGEDSLGMQYVQRDVDSCFAKNAGMLGMSVRAIVSWALGSGSAGDGSSVGGRWLLALDRVRSRRAEAADAGSVCSLCGHSLHQLLRFGCVKCRNMVACETCYLYDRDLTTVDGHKKTHAMFEVIHGEKPSRECLGGFLKDVRRLLACVRRKKPPPPDAGDDRCHVDRCQRPGVTTSTVGRAAGGAAAHALLQDIISQLESHNRSLKELWSEMERARRQGSDKDDVLHSRVDNHWGQIATQINRLNLLKEQLSTRSPHSTQLKAFDLFSPIPMLQDEAKQSKQPPRVLSLDSGQFSDTSKPSDSQLKPSNESQPDSQLMSATRDGMKPIVAHATSDSISTVSMNDISLWYANGTDTESLVAGRPPHSDIAKPRSDSLCVTEQRYDADMRLVTDSNHKMKELNADLDTALDRLQQILANNFVLDDSCWDNTALRETANEMEGLLGTLIRGVERRVSRNTTTITTSAV